MNIHAKSTAKFGMIRQLNKVAEECSELSSAINKFLAGEGQCSEIIEEAADVKFCLGYLDLYFGEKEIELVVQKKIERLAKKLDEC